MILVNEILDSLSALLHQQRPDLDILRDQLPEQFQRPCYYLEAGERRQTDAACGLVEVVQTVSVRCIGELGLDQCACADQLHAMAGDVERLLCAGFLRVGGRALHVTSLAVRQPFADAAETAITLTYFDDRPGAHDAPAPIQTVALNQRLKEDFHAAT